MIKLPNLVGFEGLLDLDRRGVDIRPTLLRVITDQYLYSPTHTPAEERQFTELALRLIDETDIATRAAVAARLAPHACAPRAIVLQLGRDVLEVADPILRLSPQLTPADLKSIIAERGPSYADIISRRSVPDPIPAPPVVAPPAPPPPRPVVPATPPAAPARQEASAPPAAVPAAEVSEPAPDKNSWELCELFFAADATERRLILMSLDYLPNAPRRLPTILQRNDAWRLESAALQHNTDAVVRDLERTLGISRRQARRIVNDEMGEPIVVVAKALQLPADVLQRMLLFMNPRVGQSVDRVYELAALYGEISVEAAGQLIAIWRKADPPDGKAAKHEALWRDAVEHARQALSDITRRSPTRRDQPTAQPAKRETGSDRG